MAAKNLILFTADITHAAATNTKASLERKGHTVTLAADSTIGATDVSGYDAIVAVRTTFSNRATIGPALRAKVDAGKPLVMSLFGSNSGTSPALQEGAATTAGFVVAITVANQTGHAGAGNEIVTNEVTHAITTGYAADTRVQVMTGGNWAAVVGSGQAYAGTVLATGDPDEPAHIGLPALLAIEQNSPDVNGLSIGSRVVLGSFFYGGQTSYTANGDTILDQAVQWATTPANLPPTVTTLSPPQDLTIPAGTIFLVRFSVVDQEDQNITDSAVVTSSNPNDGSAGALGTGSDLVIDTSEWAEGLRTITVGAMDSGGLSGSASFDLTIGATATGGGFDKARFIIHALGGIV